MKVSTENNKVFRLCGRGRKKGCVHSRGAVLLVVLLIVMAVTILSLGFLSRSDVELACGENMVLRSEIDYLAESGLEHAKGLILNPQDISSEYWRGGVGEQLYSGNDYYDVNVMRHDAYDEPTYRCNYEITCEAYRVKNGEKTGRSSLRAELRLDPCIALWTGQDMTVSGAMTISGDVYCGGAVTNAGIINGDVFASILSGSITGQHKAAGDLSLEWPRVTVADFTSHYTVELIGANGISEGTFGSCEPLRVCYRNGDLVMAGNVQVEGMLVVAGDLIIRGDGNVIIAGKNVPALLVTGDVIIDARGSLDANGLVVVDGDVEMSADCNSVDIVGGLFAASSVGEITADSSSNNNNAMLYGTPVWWPSGGQVGGALEFNGVDNKVEENDAGSYLNGLSAITVCVWVKSDVIGQDRGIMFTREPTGNDEELGIRYDASGTFGGGVRGIKASIHATSGYTQVESSSNVQTATWQHLALVWESGTSLKLYIDGQLNSLSYDKGAVTGTVTGVQKLMLGQGAKGTYWDGLIDDVRIYGRALDAGEIYPVPSEVGLIGHWKLDEEGSGDINVTAAPSKTAIVVWSETGTAENWGQAAGAFFRSIERE